MERNTLVEKKPSVVKTIHHRKEKITIEANSTGTEKNVTIYLCRRRTCSNISFFKRRMKQRHVMQIFVEIASKGVFRTFSTD